MKEILAELPTSGFAVTVDPLLARIELPRIPLHPILMSLVDNAIKHHHKGAGRIEVKAEDRGDFYAFAVQDDGPGISERFHEQIFNAFQTLRPRDQVDGSGMGLAFVRRYVETYGGALSLESKEGEGSTFGFTLPKQLISKEVSADYAIHI
jgi:signal transduction histidine kinase